MKNILLYYRGGGYSGCIWEWNFCFWDRDGVWHDLYSSGCAGLDTAEKAAGYIATGFDDSDAELVDLTDPARFKQFQKDNNAILVLNIAKVLNKQFDYRLEVTCYCCGASGESQDDEHTALDNYDIVCYECLNMRTCGCCNEFIKDDSDMVYLDDNDDPSGLSKDGLTDVCVDCYEYNIEQRKIEQQQELFQQSLLTGKPDMFGDELRDCWQAV